MPATRDSPHTISCVLTHALRQGVARADAHALLLTALGRPPKDRAWLIANDQNRLTPRQQARFEALWQQRHAGVPLAYLTEYQEFYGLSLQVDARVLDPRSDTETLVDWALDCMPAAAHHRVLDLGTGSGAVALALAHHRPQAEVWATDVSRDALQVAADNARRLGLHLTLRHGNWLQAVANDNEKFDLIVSNPPYIAAGDKHLPALRHEPIQALVGGSDGLQALRTLCAQAPRHLKPDGWLLLEHGYDQAASVRQLLQQAGLTQVQSRRDPAGVERCSGGQQPI